jgi:large subunit ribosomal protein L24
MKQPTSKKPGKQRKWRADAPLHKRQKMVSATLSKELRAKYKRRAIPVRKGDHVKVMRGDSKGISGEVNKVVLRDYRIYVDGVNAKKADGTEKPRSISPSSVMLTELFLEDKGRKAMLERKAK